MSQNKSPTKKIHFADRSAKKQFPSVSLSKHLNNYRAYHLSNGQRNKDCVYNNSSQQRSFVLNNALSPDERSILTSNMPSICCNENEDIFPVKKEPRSVKMQKKILKLLENTSKQDQWTLYMSKCQLAQQNGQVTREEFEEIQCFLMKCLLKALENPTQFSSPHNSHDAFNKTFSQSVHRNEDLLQSVQPSLKVLKETTSKNIKSNQTPASSYFLNTTQQHLNQAQNTTFLSRQQAVSAKDEELNRMTFEKSLMEKKLELCQQKIEELEKKLERGQFLDDCKDGSGVPMSNHTKDEMIKNIVEKNKYKSEAEFKKIQNETLSRQLGTLKEFSEKLKVENDDLQMQHQKIVEENLRCREFLKYRELWLMQHEETMQWKDEFVMKKEECEKLHNKILILKEKNKQLLHSFNFSMVVNPDQEEDKQELDNIIKGFQEWLKVMSVPRVNFPSIDPKKIGEEEAKVEEDEYLPDPDNMNYKLLRPNFFVFFEAYERTIMMEKNILNTRPLESTFFVKIRAILDSMYNHFNCHPLSYKQWISFPEFAMGFMEKYEINFGTHEVECRKKPMQSEEKLTFLMNLFNKKLSNTWECEMFRNFILEDYTLDEVYFFLDCRNDLNGGSTLVHGFGKSDPVVYVKLGLALATAARKLSPYEHQVIDRVKNILRSRKKEKNGDVFIDRNFVLRLLLEVYCLERKKSESLFEASFKSKGKKKQITYADFFAFMSKNFEYLSAIEICELYRETYSLCSGRLTHKGIHYICCTKGLFIPLVVSKRLNLNVLEKSLNNDMVLLDVQNCTRKMQSHLVSNGVESLSRLESDMNLFLRKMDWYRGNKQMFYFRLLEQKIQILRSNAVLDWEASTYQTKNALTTEEIRDAIMQIHTLVHQSDASVKVLSKKKEEKAKAINMLTRNFKIRIKESMKEFKRVDEEQLQMLKDQVAREIRIREVKKEEGHNDPSNTLAKTPSSGLGNLVSRGKRRSMEAKEKLEGFNSTKGMTSTKSIKRDTKQQI